MIAVLRYDMLCFFDRIEATINYDCHAILNPIRFKYTQLLTPILASKARDFLLLALVTLPVWYHYIDFTSKSSKPSGPFSKKPDANQFTLFPSCLGFSTTVTVGLYHISLCLNKHTFLEELTQPPQSASSDAHALVHPSHPSEPQAASTTAA